MSKSVNHVPPAAMFLLSKPTNDQIQRFLLRQASSNFSYDEIGATNSGPPENYTVDHNRVNIGQGESSFRRAAHAIRQWQMFNIGWVEAVPAEATVRVGMNVGVAVHHFGFWSVNACRVVYLMDEPRRYGFAYGTLEDHAEQGEERFLVEWNIHDDSVWYDILAFSRPRQWQAKLMQPLARRLQNRFARDSLKAIQNTR